MSMTVKINEVDRTEYVDAKTLKINDEITSKVNTASFDFICNDISLAPIAGESILIEENSTKLFSGRVLSKKESFLPPNLLEYSVECIDHTRYLNKKLVFESYKNQRAGDIIKHIIGKYISYTDPTWAKPTNFNDLDTEWTDEEKAYDNDIATKAISTVPLIAGWGLDKVFYENKGISVEEQTSSPMDAFFKPDGMKMYVLGLNDMVYQYSLSEAWNTESKTYDGKCFDLGTNGTPGYMFIRDDGLMMYVTESEQHRVYQYSLSIAWDIETATYVNKSTTITYSAGLWFRSDGTAFYIAAGTNRYVYQYELGTPWDITTADYNEQYFSISPQDNYAYGVIFNADGMKAYVSGRDSGGIYQYDLIAPWTLPGANYTGKSLDVSNEDTATKGFKISDLGHKLYTIGLTNNLIHQYTFAEWGSFIEFTFDSAVCDRVKYYASRISSGIDQIDIDAYYNETWNHIYQGDYTDETWIKAGFDEIQTATKVRFRFANSSTSSNYDAKIYELSIRVYEVAGFTTNNVADGPIISDISFDYIQVSDAITKIAEICGYEWYVDYDKDIYFFFKTDYSAPFQLDDNQTDYKDLVIDTDISQIRNRIYVKSSSIVDTFGEIFIGDGATTSWTCKYKAEIMLPTALETDILRWRGNAVEFSNSDTYLAVGLDWVLGMPHCPNIRIFKREGDTFTKIGDPDALPPGDANGVSWSSDDVYLAVGHNNSPRIIIYKRDEDEFTKLDNPATLPTGHGHGLDFGYNDTYLAIAHEVTPYITIYKRDEDVFTKLPDPANKPMGNGYGAAFSPDGIYLAVAHVTSPYITIYKRVNDTFTKLDNPADLPGSDAYDVAFSPDGIYLAVGHKNNPYITIYKRAGDVFTKLANPADLPTGYVTGVAFAPNSTHLATSHDNSPYITLYKRGGDTFVKVDDPSPLPTGDGLSVAFSYGNIYIAVGHKTDPRLTIYKHFVPLIKEDGVYKTIGWDEIDSSAYFDYMLNADTKVLSLGTASTPAVDVELFVIYTALGVPICFKRDDKDSIADRIEKEGGDGIIEFCIVDNNVNSLEWANEVTKSDLLQNADPTINATFMTNRSDIHSGQIITLNSTKRNINQQFILQKVELIRVDTGGASTVYVYQVTIANKFKKLEDLFLHLLDKTDVSLVGGAAGAEVAAGEGVYTFLGLTDTPSNFTDDANKFLSISPEEDAVEFVTPQADEIEVSEIGAATYDDVQDWLNNTQSGGIVAGAEISDDGDGTITLSSGQGYIRTTTGDIGLIKAFDIAADSSTGVALVDNDTNFVYVDYNAGSPKFAVTIDRDSIHISDQFDVGRVYRAGTVLHIINSGNRLYNLPRIEHERLLGVRGFERASGGVVTEIGERYLGITAGTFYLGQDKITTTAQNTSSGDRFISHYYISGAWASSTGQQQIDNLQYNDITSTGLETLTANRYGVHWVYVHYDSDINVVYGQGDYKLTEAENAVVPDILPNVVEDFGKLAAKVIIQKASTGFTSIVTAYKQLFPVSTPPGHNDLSGLQGGTADEYYHLTSAQHILATNVATTGANGLLITLDGSTGNYLRGDGSWQTPPGEGVATFLELTDTPASYAGHGFEILRVNAGSSAVEFSGKIIDQILTDDEDDIPTSHAVYDFCETTKNYALNAELHSQNTDTDLDATFEATFVKKADNVNVLADITSVGANIEDAVTKKHLQNTDTQFDFYNALASDHTWSGQKDTQPVGETVVFGDLLYFNWTDKEWKRTDADSAATMPGLRIALESKSNGQTCLMLVKGYIRADAKFQFAASMVYASTVIGSVSHIAPTESGDQIQRVGVAKSADILFFDPSMDVGEI